jgi:hypothetical protein
MQHSPDEHATWQPARACVISNTKRVYFAADAALAASAAALAAAAESAAADAAESAAAGAGVTAGAGASVLLPQALSMNAATKALKASLVFIYRYPRNFKDKSFGRACCFGP